MFKANYSILEIIFSALPYFKSNSDVLSNASEAIKIIDNNVVDAREIDMINCIKTMLKYLSENMEFDNKTIIEVSSSSAEMAESMVIKSSALTDEFKEWTREYLDIIAINKDVLSSTDAILKSLEEFESAPLNRMNDKMRELIRVVESTVLKIDKKATNKSSSSVIFGKKIEGMSNIIDQFRYEEKNAIKTGIPVVDELTGGYRPKKLYCNIALTGGFKSGFLENVTMGMRKSNRDVEKIDGLENGILHITFENDLLQIFKRFIDYSHAEKFYSKKYLKDMSDEEIIDLANDCLIPKDENDMTIVIQQYPRYSLAPHNLTKIVSDLRRKGVRVVAIVLDYADLLAAPPQQDGDVEDGSKMPIVRKFEHLKLIAQKLNCPIITAGQFNRQGEAEAKQSKLKYPSPLMGSLNASHVAGGYGLKFHVESLIIQYRGAYNGKQLLHFLLDKDRDGNVEESDQNAEINSGKILRFVAFEDNGFKISTNPKDVYTDIRDVVPIDDGGIIAAAFSSVDVNDELKKQMKEKASADKKLLESLN